MSGLGRRRGLSVSISVSDWGGDVLRPASLLDHAPSWMAGWPAVSPRPAADWEDCLSLHLVAGQGVQGGMAA